MGGSGRFRLPPALLGALLCLLAPPATAQIKSPFTDWAAVVVAGDYRAQNGKPSEVFDNARRDLVSTLTRTGFKPDAIHHFSVRPALYPDTKPLHADLESVARSLFELADANKAGCLFYLTSHGAPEGVLVGREVFTPQDAGKLIDLACGERPTVAVISACFSGVFVPALEGANRMVLTAARPDRPSFGCGEDEVYTYFDDCVLTAFKAAKDFLALGRSAQACVAAKEKETKLPASEPQMVVGGTLKLALPLLPLAGS